MDETYSKRDVKKEFIIGYIIASIVTLAFLFMTPVGIEILIIVMWLTVFSNGIVGFIILSNQRVIEEMRKEDG